LRKLEAKNEAEKKGKGKENQMNQLKSKVVFAALHISLVPRISPKNRDTACRRWFWGSLVGMKVRRRLFVRGSPKEREVLYRSENFKKS